MHWIQVVDTLNLLFSYFLASNSITPGNKALLCVFWVIFYNFFSMIERISMKLYYTDNCSRQEEKWFFRFTTQPFFRWWQGATTTLLSSRPQPDEKESALFLQDRNRSYGCQPKIQAGICSSRHQLFLPVQPELPTPPIPQCPWVLLSPTFQRRKWTQKPV